MFSPKSLIVSVLTFRYLIDFEFIFEYGVRECSHFILFHVPVQFSQHHLLKRLSFLHSIFAGPPNNIPLRAKGYLESGIGLITNLSLSHTLTLTPTMKKERI